MSRALAPLAAQAAMRLELDRFLERLTLCLDDISADERVWLSCGPGPVMAVGTRRSLTIYLHPDHLVRDHPAASSLLPGRAVWEPPSQLPAEQLAAVAKPFRPKMERFLYHQFLSIRDLSDGSVLPAAVPPDQAESFQEVWAVTVDGRLRQQILPSYSAGERRLRFSRIFGAAAVLLPAHWDIFHELWEMETVTQERLVAAARRLPFLRQTRQF